MDTTELGPVEYLSVSFPGSRFDGRIVPALQQLVEQDIIRVIDLVFVLRDDEGTVVAVELTELDEDDADTFAPLASDDAAMLNDEDLELVAEALDPGDSAAIVVWEDLWAIRLATALRDAGAEILALERVPRSIVDQAVRTVP